MASPAQAALGFRLIIGMFGTQKPIHGMIHEAIMNPFDLAGDAFELEAQTFGDRAAAGVLGGALDRDPVQFPDIETVINQRVATGGHDAFALVPGVQPIPEGGQRLIQSTFRWLITPQNRPSCQMPA